MKNKIVLIAALACLLPFAGRAQEKFGNTLNLGLGVGGYSGYAHYAGAQVMLSANYEFDVARNFTLAPFVALYTYSDRYYWEGPPAGYYHYHETVVPIGVTGMYYFDDLLDLTRDWDVYAGASLGAGLVSAHWPSGYPGDRTPYHGSTLAVFDLHAGGEYHLNQQFGLFVDLSTTSASFGLAVHGH